MIKTQYKYSDITSNIIGAAMEVHKILGNGFQEKYYHKALGHEFTLRHIEFHSEFPMPVYYKKMKLGTRRVDFMVSQVIAVEIKAVISLEDVHLAQSINYLEAYNLEIGMLLNFGAKSLEFKRVHNKRLTMTGD
ncbi:GxxExxY protein [Desulfobacterales bacterium HSG17]|nr:GxxExxY protein [Desulfobacterales bacterium HSG17]